MFVYGSGLELFLKGSCHLGEEKKVLSIEEKYLVHIITEQALMRKKPSLFSWFNVEWYFSQFQDKKDANPTKGLLLCSLILSNWVRRLPTFSKIKNSRYGLAIFFTVDYLSSTQPLYLCWMIDSSHKVGGSFSTTNLSDLNHYIVLEKLQNFCMINSIINSFIFMRTSDFCTGRMHNRCLMTLCFDFFRS